MDKRVLIIEDLDELAELIELYFHKEGMRTLRCSRAEAALDILAAGVTFDLLLLDLNLPGMDGFEFLRRFRQQHHNPVLIVSARETEEDILTGLELGADEYICKPFSPRILVARARALLRRDQELAAAGPRGPESGVYRFGPFTLDVPAYLLRNGTGQVKLSSRELEVLAYLAARAGTVVSPQEIFTEVCKLTFGDLSAVAVYIQRLRRKLGDDPQNARYIQTVHGAGYRFNAESLVKEAGR
jgi:DNA-binding response OmpR family regulator